MRRSRLGLAAAIGVAAAFAACASSTDDRSTSPPLVTASTPAPAPSASAVAPATARADLDTVVALLEPDDLATLEARGFTMSEVVLGTKATSTEDLSKTGFASILDALRDDVARSQKEHPLARVSSVLGTRLFDASWLRSREMSFALVGVFNRIDRKAFYAGTCGEVRFVYRLAYETKQGPGVMKGRLPLTLNVVFLLEPGSGDCADLARSWQTPKGLAGTALVDHLTKDGALSAGARQAWKLKAVETNFQTVRVQSTAHPSMGGHIEYTLHVFHPKDDARTAFEAAPMPNMPDVARLSKDPAQRAELLATLRDPKVLRSIDEGTLQLDDRFLARTAISVAPRGLARPANRPFDALFDEADLEGLPLADLGTIKTTAALLRRLDGLTCVGCHQSRTLAGFHHVGRDRTTDAAWASLVSSSSVHLAADLGRRTDYVAAVAEGRAPTELRPHAEVQGQGGTFGAPCGLGDAGFAAWTCAEGLRCVAAEDPHIGVCLDADPIGAPCEMGKLVPGDLPRKDGIGALTPRSCGASLGCSGNISGFPMGACAARCGAESAEGTCQDFVDIDGLQACLRVGLDANECGERYGVERLDRACDVDTHCRQDFVCARSESDPAHGACVPPYFVLGLRADGYPMKR